MVAELLVGLDNAPFDGLSDELLGIQTFAIVDYFNDDVARLMTGTQVYSSNFGFACSLAIFGSLNTVINGVANHVNQRIPYLLYDVLIILSALFLLPALALKRLLKRHDSYGIRERFGLYKEDRFAVLENRKTVWMHAASVGETNVALLLARQTKEDYPDHAVLITNMTKSTLQ